MRGARKSCFGRGFVAEMPFEYRVVGRERRELGLPAWLRSPVSTTAGNTS